MLSREALEALGIKDPAFLERMGVTISPPAHAAQPEPPKPTAPAAPADNAFGFWRGEASGSILRFTRSGSSSRPIAVTGTAFKEDVEGSGTFENNRIKIAIQLRTSGRKIGLELWFMAPDWINGKATGESGETRDTKFTRIAVDAEGAWQDGRGSALTFGPPKLDWHEGEQRVQAEVTGYVFGRWGKGRFSFYGSGASGSFEATDYTFYNRYLKDAFARNHMLSERDLRSSYRRDCPREGWWANDVLFIGLRFSRDGSSASGTVKPSDVTQRIDDLVQTGRDTQDAIEEPIHLTRTGGGARSTDAFI
jgi:hypothetical protein